LAKGPAKKNATKPKRQNSLRTQEGRGKKGLREEGVERGKLGETKPAGKISMKKSGTGGALQQKL